MKRLFSYAVCAVLLVALTAPAFAAAEGPLLGPWSTATTTGTYTPRSNAASAVANSRLWVIGGVDANGDTVNTVQGLWLLLRSWELKTPMPTARKDAAAVTANNKVYVFGGYVKNLEGNDVPTGVVEVFDPVANTWTTKTPMQVPRGGPIAVFYNAASGPQIHVYGGDSAGGFPGDHAYEIYDVNTDTWAPAPHMTPSVQMGCFGAAAKDITSGVNYLYMLGGFSGGGQPGPGAWRIDPASGENWDTKVHAMPGGRQLSGVVTVTAKSAGNADVQYPIVIGGNTDRSDTLTATNFVYESGPFNGWVAGPSAVPDLPEPRGNRPAVCEFSGKVYVASGSVAGGPAVDVLQATVNTGNYPPAPPVEDPLLVGWEDVDADIITPRWYPAFAVADGKLFVMGGWDEGRNVLGVNEAYDPATNSWSTKAPMPVPVRGAAAASIDGKIYVAGGAGIVNPYECTLQVYDAATDSWTIGTSLTTPRDLVTGFALDGKFHVLAGANVPDTGMGTGEHEVYDPATGTWTYHTIGCPWSMADASTAVVADGDHRWVYFAGGWNWQTQMSYAARWNGVTGGSYNDQWYRIANLPVGGNSGMTAATLTDQKGMQWPAVFGGHFGPIGYFDKVFVYHDPSDPVFGNQWVADSSLPYPRGGRMAVAQIGDHIYVAAGMGPLGLATDTWRSAIGSGLAKDVERIGEAIAELNGKKVNFTVPKIVTRVHTSFVTGETYFWIQDEDRSAGIKVGPTLASVNPGNKVTLSGALATSTATGERIILPTSMTVDPQVYPIPDPIGITNRSFIGGGKGSQPGRNGGFGLNNMGMLATVWGKVSVPTQWWYPDEDGMIFFYLDDGAALVDGSHQEGIPNSGLRVKVFYAGAELGQYVSVTGIVGSEKADGVTVPVLISDDVFFGTGIKVWGP